MAERNPVQTFIRGTAIKTTTVLDIATATSVKITIDDPGENEVVSSVSMTKEADKIYSYVWQSETTNEWGDYVVTIEIVYNSYTTVKQSVFTLVEQKGSE